MLITTLHPRNKHGVTLQIATTAYDLVECLEAQKTQARNKKSPDLGLIGSLNTAIENAKLVKAVPQRARRNGAQLKVKGSAFDPAIVKLINYLTWMGKTYKISNFCLPIACQSVTGQNASAPCCSGLKYTGPKIPAEPPVTAGGRMVQIYGSGQKTGMAVCSNNVNAHGQTSINIAVDAAKTGAYEYLTLDRSWSTATGGASSYGRRPDVIGIRCDGKVLAWEVISVTDDMTELEMRVKAGYATLPAVNRGAPVSAYVFVTPIKC
jgi:hypothetical protein